MPLVRLQRIALLLRELVVRQAFQEEGAEDLYDLVVVLVAHVVIRAAHHDDRPDVRYERYLSGVWYLGGQNQDQKDTMT